MPHAILLCGPPGCGKSTFKRENLHEFVTLSTDMLILREAEQRKSTYAEIFKSYIGEAQALYDEHFEMCNIQKLSYVVDRTNLTVKSRAATLSKVSKDHTKVAIYFPSYPPDILMLRIKEREEQPIPEGTVKAMASFYVPPSYKEGFDLIIPADEFVPMMKVMQWKK